MTEPKQQTIADIGADVPKQWDADKRRKANAAEREAVRKKRAAIAARKNGPNRMIR